MPRALRVVCHCTDRKPGLKSFVLQAPMYISISMAFHKACAHKGMSYNRKRNSIMILILSMTLQADCKLTANSTELEVGSGAITTPGEYAWDWIPHIHSPLGSLVTPVPTALSPPIQLTAVRSWRPRLRGNVGKGQHSATRGAQSQIPEPAYRARK